MAFVQAESESIESIACQGVLIGHDVPRLLDEIERLRLIIWTRAPEALDFDPTVWTRYAKEPFVSAATD